MKKIILSLTCGTALLCGCNKSNTDSTKIEQLSKKLDAVLQNQSITISNQIIIWNEVEAVKSEVTNDTVLINGIFTDAGNIIELDDLDMKAIESHVDSKIESTASVQAVTSGLLLDSVGFLVTNRPSATPPNDVERMLKIERESDFEQMKVDVDDIQEDLRKIKTRLGIPY